MFPLLLVATIHFGTAPTTTCGELKAAFMQNPTGSCCGDVPSSSDTRLYGPHSFATGAVPRPGCNPVAEPANLIVEYASVFMLNAPLTYSYTASWGEDIVSFPPSQDASNYPDAHLNLTNSAGETVASWATVDTEMASSDLHPFGGSGGWAPNVRRLGRWPDGKTFVVTFGGTYSDDTYITTLFPWVYFDGADAASASIATRLNNGFCASNTYVDTTWKCYDFPQGSSRSSCMPIVLSANAIQIR